MLVGERAVLDDVAADVDRKEPVRDARGPLVVIVDALDEVAVLAPHRLRCRRRRRVGDAGLQQLHPRRLAVDVPPDVAVGAILDGL